MKRVYRVKTGRWLRWILFGVLLIQIPVVLDRYREFSESPGPISKVSLIISGSVLFCWLCYMWFRLRIVQVVTVNDEKISFQKVRGDRSWPEEVLTAITEDPVEFHLYSDKRGISVTKRTIDPELEKFLTERADDYRKENASSPDQVSDQ